MAGRLAVATALIATVGAIFAYMGGLAQLNAGLYKNESAIKKTEAANQWAFYQAKSMKSDLYALAKASTELEQQALPAGASRSLTEAYARRADEYAKRVARYDQEKAQIQSDARAQEKIRDDAQKHGGIFGIAVIFLQISILLSSIAALLKKKPVWILGLAVGLAGIVYFLDGFFLFF